MENNFIENPWNLTLKSYDWKLSEKKCKLLLKHGLIGQFNFLKNMPNLFNKFDNLVLCNKCQILVCKNSCLKHAKLCEKDKNKDTDMIYKVPSSNEINNIIHESDLNLDGLKKQSIKASRIKLQNNSKEKRRKVSEDKPSKVSKKSILPFEDDKNGDVKINHFVPKSTLNAANPLRIKIQLQPKFEAEPRNGNIFDNLNNFCKNINNLQRNQTLNGESEIANLNNETLTRMKEHNHMTTNRVITIQKYHPGPQHRSSSVRPVSENSRPYGTAIINHSIPEYTRLPNQTSSLSSQTTAVSPPLSQQPQVFQNFRQGTFPGRSSQKKYVEVKSLGETHVPVSSTQSLHLPQTNPDQNQISFQKILIDNGMFSEEDIKRAQKPNFDRNPLNDVGHVGKVRKTNNVPVRLHQNNTRPRFISNYLIRPSARRSTGLIISNSDPFLASQQPSSTIRNHNSQRYQSISLSDDEFLLDQTVVDNHKAKTAHQLPPSVHKISPYAQSNSEFPRPMLTQSSSINKNRNNQTSAQIPRDYNADVHYLPPPEQTITSLSWEQ